MSTEKIVVRNTCIYINDYHLGDSERLESVFKVWNPVTHSYDVMGYYYDEENSRLYIPGGLDLWKVRSYFGERYYDREPNHSYLTIPNIMMRFPPRDDEQRETLRFSCGLNEYADNAMRSQLCICNSTGSGKTYCSIATIAYHKMKSIVITGSSTLLDQWRKEIIKYTNLTDNDIMKLDGSNVLNMILAGRSRKAQEASIFLCTHGTLRSFGDTYGWDKVYQVFYELGIGLKFFDEAHTNFNNMLMIDFFTNVFRTYYVTATPGRSSWRENRIFQLSIKNVPTIDLFNEDKDPHTHYVAIKWNSQPSPKDISRCKNAYGLDRMKYIDYLTKNEEFYKLMHIVMELVKSADGRVLIYIGTNDGILRVYHWIGENYREFIGDIGIFSSANTKEEKMKDRGKKILLSTTKSAGLGEDIKGLKMTILLAEPFKSEILARQTLGRTRDSNTFYIEFVDLGFRQTRNFYYSKLPVFNKYALSTSDDTIDKYELDRRAENIIRSRTTLAIPAIGLYDDRFDFDAALGRSKMVSQGPRKVISFIDEDDINPYTSK